MTIAAPAEPMMCLSFHPAASLLMVCGFWWCLLIVPTLRVLHGIRRRGVMSKLLRDAFAALSPKEGKPIGVLV